jgi:hypothetical protein
LIALCFCCLIFEQVEQINITRAFFQILERGSRQLKGSRLIFARSTAWLLGAGFQRRAIHRCDNSRVELSRCSVIITTEKRRIKNTDADQRRHEEERMGLSPMALNVAMAVIGISIPLLIYAGCIITRKKKTPSVPEATTHYEFDRAA